MKKKIKLLKAWKYMSNGAEVEHKAGSILEVDEDNFKTLTTGESPLAEEWTEAKEEDIKAAEEAEAKRMKTLAEATIKAIAEKQNGLNPREAMFELHMKDKSDDDPTYGYCPQKIGKLTDADRKFGFGLFAGDVYNAREGATSPALQKCQERGAKAIKEGREWLAEKSGALVSHVGQDVGYMIPPEFNTMLLTGAEEQSVVRPRATGISLTGNAVDLPYVEDFDRSSDLLYGGVVAYWTAEEGTYTASKPKMGKIQLKLNKLTCMGVVTDEAMRFSPFDIGQYLLPKFEAAIAWKEDLAFMEGTGAGMPLGFRNSLPYTSAVVAKEAAQTADTIVLNNVAKMFARIRKKGMGGLVWLVNDTTLPQLITLADANGNSLFIMNRDISNGPQQSLMGIPLVYSEKAPVVGDEGDITLCDFSDYIVADDRRGPDVQQSMHLYFDTGKNAFRVTKFVDGQPGTKKAYTPKRGDSLSPYVTLAERA